MIGYLRGTLAAIRPPQLVIDVNGIGYEVAAPLSTCLELPKVGAEIHLITHLIVREDQHTLYGFATESERQLFRDLIKVNRVGAKLALGILSGMTVNTFIACIRTEDATLLSKLPGVGRKTAERLIMDMRDKVDGEAQVLSVSKIGSSDAANGSRQEAFNALTSLGYKPLEARKMLDQVDADLSGTEDILRSVLRAAAPAGGQP
jgi:Holliday junction DNA helicase RuvA